MSKTIQTPHPTKALSNSLCHSCLQQLTVVRQFHEEDGREKRTGETIEKLHQRKCHEMKVLINSLSDEKKQEHWFWIAGVVDRAERRAQKFLMENTWIPASDGELLYEILLAESWRGASLYDPNHDSNESFSSWVWIRWNWAISRFIKAKRLATVSLQDPLGGKYSDETRTRADRISDIRAVDPMTLFTEDDENDVELYSDNLSHTDNYLITEYWNGTDCLCPYCRTKVSDFLLRNKKPVARRNNENDSAAIGVYARYRLWRNLLQDASN